MKKKKRATISNSRVMIITSQNPIIIWENNDFSKGGNIKLKQKYLNFKCSNHIENHIENHLHLQTKLD